MDELPESRGPKPKKELLFVHGAGSGADFWHLQRAAFPNVHYVDLPGHGSYQLSAISYQPSGVDRLSLEGYADWVAGYVETTGLGGAVLDGHSMGGAIALILALRRPGWLRAVILTSAGARLPVSPNLLELLRSDYPAAVEAIIAASFARPAGPPSYALKLKMNGARRSLLRIPPEVTLADYEACGSFDVSDRLREIKVPALCIVGAQDAMVPPECSEELHRAIGGSHLEVVDGAGHMLPLEKPDEYNRIVAEFVNNLSMEPA
jgi:pimeloyl-ACP methyl ester carboxylesterase